MSEARMRAEKALSALRKKPKTANLLYGGVYLRAEAEHCSELYIFTPGQKRWLERQIEKLLEAIDDEE